MAEPTYPTDDGGGRDRSDVAEQRGREVAERAGAEGRQVADTARGEAGRVAEETRRQAQNVMEEARQQLREQAETQTQRAGGAIQQFGGRVHAMAEGRPEEAGPLPEYADRLASQVDELAGRVNELGLDGMLAETQRFARRRPGAFLIGAAVAGFAVSRLGRGAKEADGSRDAGGDGITGRAPDSPGRTAATSPIATAGNGRTERAGLEPDPQAVRSEVRR